MTATKIVSNKNVGVFVGPATAIADITAPTLAELNTLVNVSDAIQWNQFTFGLQASQVDQDRELTAGVDAASRGYDAFNGSINFYTPTPLDTSSVYRVAKNLVAVPHTELAVVIRTGISASAAWAAGQVFNSYHVITDANKQARGPKDRYYTIHLKEKGFCGVNRIVPSSVATAVTVTPGTLAVNVGKAIQLKSVYEGNDITIGATYTVSDVTKAFVTKHGLVIGLATGTPTVTVSYPGSAAGTPKTITVS